MTQASAGERKILVELLDLQAEARGDHPALAEVRRQVAERIDAFLATLAGYGVDTDALLDELDP